jgi:hypothetical protein
VERAGSPRSALAQESELGERTSGGGYGPPSTAGDPLLPRTTAGIAAAGRGGWPFWKERYAGDWRDRGQVAGVAFFHKPWGGRTPEGERPGCLAVVLLG